MLTKLTLDEYIVHGDKGIKFSDTFYQLSLSNKYCIVGLLEEAGLLENRRVYELLVKALVQHSSPLIKREYPVKGERKIRPEARDADRLEALQALFIAFDSLLPAIQAEAEEKFETYTKAVHAT